MWERVACERSRHSSSTLSQACQMCTPEGARIKHESVADGRNSCCTARPDVKQRHTCIGVRTGAHLIKDLAREASRSKRAHGRRHVAASHQDALLTAVRVAKVARGVVAMKRSVACGAGGWLCRREPPSCSSRGTVAGPTSATAVSTTTVAITVIGRVAVARWLQQSGTLSVRTLRLPKPRELSQS